MFHQSIPGTWYSVRVASVFHEHGFSLQATAVTGSRSIAVCVARYAGMPEGVPTRMRATTRGAPSRMKATMHAVQAIERTKLYAERSQLLVKRARDVAHSAVAADYSRNVDEAVRGYRLAISDIRRALDADEQDSSRPELERMAVIYERRIDELLRDAAMAHLPVSTTDPGCFEVAYHEDSKGTEALDSSSEATSTSAPLTPTTVATVNSSHQHIWHALDALSHSHAATSDAATIVSSGDGSALSAYDWGTPLADAAHTYHDEALLAMLTTPPKHEADAGTTAWCETPLDEAFEYFDEDGDGAITPAKLQRGLSRIGCHISADHTFELIGAADSNGSGAVEVAEFGRLWSELTGDEGRRSDSARQRVVARAVGDSRVHSRLNVHRRSASRRPRRSRVVKSPPPVKSSPPVKSPPPVTSRKQRKGSQLARGLESDGNGRGGSDSGNGRAGGETGNNRTREGSRAGARAASVIRATPLEPSSGQAYSRGFVDGRWWALGAATCEEMQEEEGRAVRQARLLGDIHEILISRRAIAEAAIAPYRPPSRASRTAAECAEQISRDSRAPLVSKVPPMPSLPPKPDKDASAKSTQLGPLWVCCGVRCGVRSPPSRDSMEMAANEARPRAPAGIQVLDTEHLGISRVLW